MVEIEKKEEADREEREKVKLLGGRRIQIEDTDGSENEEDYEEKAIKIDVDEASKTRKSTNKPTSDIKPVKIAQVESDDEDSSSSSSSSGDDDDQEKDYGSSPSSQKDTDQKTTDNDESKEGEETSTSLVVEKEEVREENNKPDEPEFELEARLVKEKDQANKAYKNGQYGDAVGHFTRVIDELNNLVKSCPSKKNLKKG